jgi:RimJ/RimL family protein N-acetyltransferase
VDSFVSMRTARLRLDAVSVIDLQHFHLLHSDPETYRHAPEAQHPDLEHSASVLDGYLQDWSERQLGYWSVRDPATNQYLGCGGVRHDGTGWNVYYRFFPAVWGHGFATELIRAAAPCAELLDPGAVLHAAIRPWNSASIAVAERLGMTRTHLRLDPGEVAEWVYEAEARDLG